MSKDQNHDTNWNPLDESVLKDQRSAYDAMREKCPVAYSEFMKWSVFRHQDILAILADTEKYSNVSLFQAIPNGIDPPEHTLYREALNTFFDENKIAKLEPSARAIAKRLMANLEPDNGIDFVKDFATPFALKTLCAYLGWPEKHWECLGGWNHDSAAAAFSRDASVGAALAKLFAEHVKANLTLHRASPSALDDATTGLIATEVSGVRFDDDQIVSILRNWTAGHGTVVGALGIVVQHLCENQELQNKLRVDPSLIPAAIEEILRVDGPLVANPRTTTREVEVGGRAIPKGERLTLMWIAANRDPRAFDDPDEVKLDRNNEQSLVWGSGVHLCQGASMARLEMRVALEELLTKTKSFELTDETPSRAVYPGNGYNKLKMRFS